MRFKSNISHFLWVLLIAISSNGCLNQNDNKSADGSGLESTGFQLIATPGPELLRSNDALHGYEGVSFGYASELAHNVSGAKKPAYTDFGIFYASSSSIRADMPDYIEITLQTDSLPARIGVQPIRTPDNQAYTGFSAPEMQRISVIENDVRTLSGAVDIVPPPPQLGYIQFANGTGRRYLAFKPTANAPQTFNNENLYYVFEGVTTNGRYLVWFEYPISTSFLANLDATVTAETIFSQLDDLPADLFTPQLIQLDAVVTSLSIEPIESFNYTTTVDSPEPGQLVVTLGDIVSGTSPEVYAVNQAANQQFTSQMPAGMGLKQVILTVPAGDYQVFAHVPGDSNGMFLGYWDVSNGTLQTVTVRSGQNVADPILTLADDPCSQVLPATPDGKYSATNSDTFKNLLGCVPAVSAGGGSGRGSLYTVRAGDNLYRIGLSQGVSWSRIAQVNGLSWPYTIYPGQQLIIPAP